VEVTEDQGRKHQILPAHARLDPARDYYVRVTTRTRPLGGSFLGLTKTVTGQVKFTFVP